MVERYSGVIGSSGSVRYRPRSLEKTAHMTPHGRSRAQSGLYSRDI
jgi:hypothetical protein